jgi:hypothetical protein
LHHEKVIHQRWIGMLADSVISKLPSPVSAAKQEKGQLNVGLNEDFMVLEKLARQKYRRLQK